MKKCDTNRFKALLIAKRDEIQGGSCHREDIWIVPSNELIETVQLAGERDLAVRTLERETKCLAQIEAALERIEDGEFGICLECEEPVSPKRLAAVPWTAYCLQCQEWHDRRESAHRYEPQLAA
ncbi:MAG: TraR/DksA family transcriptional regulator [Bryobacterales bacterium]|nr:TraR/DksA family transcriptional regulator [Bryobacterales bacterium]